MGHEAPTVPRARHSVQQPSGIRKGVQSKKGSGVQGCGVQTQG